MKHILPSLIILAALATPALLRGQVPPVSQVPLAGDSAEKSTTPQRPVTGNQLMRRAVLSMQSQRSIAANMRHRIVMFGHEMVGTGSYQQLGTGDDQLLRLEMKVKVGEQITSVQQVCDGRFMWIRRDVGDSVELGRVDLRRVRLMNQSQPARRAPEATGLISLGGLPKMLASSEENFLFAAPLGARLEGKPVWVVQGSWRHQMLAELLPQHKDQVLAGKLPPIQDWPGHLPSAVRVVLSRKHLVPLRIEYLRPSAEAIAGHDSHNLAPLVAVELHAVRLGAQIDPLQFVYKPGDQEVADHTELYLKRLNLSPPQHATKPKESSKR